jgi:hypothetical protein
MEHAERSISVHECGVSSKSLRELRLCSVGPTLDEELSAGLSNEMNGTEEKKDDSHDSQRYPDGSKASLETLEDLENIENLDLMNDDLDIYLDDENHFPPADADTHDTAQYEEGFVGEVHYLPPSTDITPRNPPPPPSNSTHHQYNEQTMMDAEQEEVLARIKQQLLATASEDNSFKPSGHSFFPQQEHNRYATHTAPPPTTTMHDEPALNNFHLI